MLEWAALALAQTVVDEFERVEPEISQEVRDLVSELGVIPGEEWVERVTSLGEAGDLSAWQALGEIFMHGLGDIERDPARGCDYFARVATARGDSLHSLAHCYWSGHGREQDYAQARVIYQQAIEAGYLTSLCGLGSMLVRGEGGPVEGERGLALCRLAAEQGDANAQTDVGTFLLMGQGVERDPVAARLWLEEAGGQGQANAAHLLGQIYARGDGVSADRDRSEHWFRRAHEAGRPDSAWELARSLTGRGYQESDEGTLINAQLLTEAREWSLIAAEIDPDPQTREQAVGLAEGLARLLSAASQE